LPAVSDAKPPLNNCIKHNVRFPGNTAVGGVA